MNGDARGPAAARTGSSRYSRSPASSCGSSRPRARAFSASGWPSVARRSRWASPSASSTGTARRLLRPSARLIAVGAAAGGAMTAAHLSSLSGGCAPCPFHCGRCGDALRGVSRAAAGVAAIALVPVVLGEELVWRGAVQAALVRPPRAARGVSLAARRLCARACGARLPPPGGGGAACAGSPGARCAPPARVWCPLLVAHLVWDVLVLLWLPLDRG